ncbi:hypothetical protein CBER1_11284 [Cercospora berteroae]|uniref:Uncharacterized protein n=1 Tax=Cercospora berteroae TaxID=357750 RepID=A0A2S6BZ97_9PEZI|nr:hypothetical protein CBER1_11284 [Cercospora berteroae]
MSAEKRAKQRHPSKLLLVRPLECDPHIAIEPEDVWFAILAQVSFYINAYAEKLRHLFVAHQGRKKLVIEQVGTLPSADIGGLAVQMTNEIQKNIVDPSLRTWIMPYFTTTTTEEEHVVAMGLICGIPTVTLLGEKEDWEDIEKRLDKLQILGKEPKQFSDMLRPILKYFLMSFEEPAAPAVEDFRGKIAHHQSGGNGPTHLSGWIAAFCFWDEKGQSLFRLPDRNGCDLDVPVTLNDNGKVHHTKMLAGSVGIQASCSPSQLSTGMPSLKQNSSSTGDASRTATIGSTQLDTLQPVCGWWMFEIDPDAPDPETQRKLREQKQSEHMRKQSEDMRKQLDDSRKRCA